jgi:hypothetical protein
MIKPMTIQVTAVEDMKNSSEGLLPVPIYGAKAAKGSGARRGAVERVGIQIVALNGPGAVRRE